MAKSQTVSRDRLAEALNVNSRTLDRAYTGDLDCFYSRHDQRYDLAKLAGILNAEPKFLLDCLNGRDKALKRKEVRKLIGQDKFASLILRPVIHYGIKTIRYSANDLSAITKPRKRHVSDGMFTAQGGAA